MDMPKMRQKRKLFDVIDGTKILLSAIFISLVIIPLVRMFSNINLESIKLVFSSQNFTTVVINTLTVGFVATLITVVTSYLLARAVYRSAIRGKELFSVIFTLPMLVPSISLGMGLIMLFGNNGIVTKLLGFDGGIYGMWGIVLGSVLYSLPVAYLMFADVMKYEDASPYEAAAVLGVSKLRQFFVITLPYLKKPLISIVFAIFTLIVTDYGVPMAVGGNYMTIPRVMYDEVAGQMEYGKGAVWGAMLLVPALIAFLFDLFNKDGGNSTFVTKKFEETKTIGTKVFSYIICTFAAIFSLSPVGSFIFLAFTKVQQDYIQVLEKMQ